MSAKVGALGFVPRVADFVYPIHIVKKDPDNSEMPFRNARGLCEVRDP